MFSFVNISQVIGWEVVLCEYSKFRIESNSYCSIRCETSTIIRRILSYHHQFLTYLTEWRQFFTLATTPSNQQNQQTWSRLLAHYGPPSTETPTTETATVRCHKNSWIYLTSTYYWWLLRPTMTIRFNLIENEKTLFAQHYWEGRVYCNSQVIAWLDKKIWSNSQSTLQS